MAEEVETPTEPDTTDDAPELEGTEVTETETVEDTDKPDAPEVEEWTPPTRAEWDKLQKAQKEAASKLQKVNKESADRRAKIRDLERQNEDDTAKAQREALEAAQARYKPVVAKSALLEAQARTDRVGSLIKLLDMDSLEFNGDDEVVGLDTEVERLRTEYPEWFAQDDKPEDSKPAPKPAPKATTAPKKPVKPEPKTAGEMIAMQLLGQ
jgi:hypothetical protein